VIRVLLIAPSLDILGGQAMQAFHIMKGMGKQPDIRITMLPINPRLPRPLRFLQKVRYIRTISTFALYIPLLLAQAARCDVVHVFSASFYSYLLWTLPAILVGKLYGKKVILNYRDGRCEEHLRNWKTALPTIRLADAIITPSAFLVDVFRKFGVEARPIFDVVELDLFRYRQRGPVQPVFMTNRILEPLYNVGCILRAFAIIQKKYPNASLTIAHDGVCRPELEKLAETLQLRETRFVGRVPREQVADLYDAAEIYLTSPNFDCMPGSLLECFACGLPIVATNAGGIPYISANEVNALLVRGDDHVALAEAAMRLLEDPELVRRLTAAGREEVKRYVWDQVEGLWLQLYHELASR
jgi:glycosyltransferase involved in cell wall biosynthesis